MGWEKTTRAMEEDYSPIARKVVALYYQAHCAWYAEGKQVVPGNVLATFKDAEKWNCGSGMDGRCHEIEMSAATSAEIAKMWVGDKLPEDGKLVPLALKMIKRTIDWIHTVHKHLDLEFTKLMQQHISMDDTLILLSEELIIMYTRIHMVRHQQMKFVVNKANKVDYMTRCIWITCQVHQVIQEIVQGGLKYNSAISTANVQFLTKTTGGNVASGVGGQLKTLTNMIATLKSLVTMVAKEAKEVAQAAKEANTHASFANMNADAAKNAVNSIYTKNSTLKC